MVAHNNTITISTASKSKNQCNHNHQSNPIHRITYIDLFCGLGAFHTAFNRCETDTIKYECVLACDIDDGVRGVYAENYGIVPNGDINALVLDDIPDVDILCAGFPCQPFSIAGKQDGFDDAQKGNLFHSILKIVDHKMPRVLILQNTTIAHNRGTEFL